MIALSDEFWEIDVEIRLFLTTVCLLVDCK